MEIKDLIKTKRIERGLTTTELAKKVGVSQSTVTRWESGNIATMKQSMIVKLADALGISPVEIIFTKEPIQEHTPIEEKLLEDFRSLSASGQRDLLRYLRMLKADEEEQYKKEEKISG